MANQHVEPPHYILNPQNFIITNFINELFLNDISVRVQDAS